MSEKREERTKEEGMGGGDAHLSSLQQEVEAGGQSSKPSPLYSELEASLGYRRHCLKEKKIKPEAHRCQLIKNLCIYL